MGPHTIKALRHFKSRYPIQAHHRILEIGSRSWNGSIRKEFEGYHYTGYDLLEGNGVDVVNADGLTLSEFFSGNLAKFNLILSCDMLEHTPEPWVEVDEMAKCLAPHGILFLLAPMAWPDHKCPVDCWRFLPDGMRHLAHRSGLKVEECYSFPSGSFLPAFDSLLSVLHWINGKRLGIMEWPKTGHAHTVCIARKI